MSARPPDPPRTRPRWRGIVLASAAVLVALAIPASLWGLLPGERALDDVIVGWASPVDVAVLEWINYLGDKRFLIPATLLLLWTAPPGARRRWWLWAAVMIAAPGLEGIGKHLIGRPRPGGHGAGFPSGHATAAAAYFFLAAYLIGQRLPTGGARRVLLWVLAGIVITLVGVARIVLRAHWPADAAAGAALGLACVALAAWYHEERR